MAIAVSPARVRITYRIAVAACFALIVFFGLFHITESPPFTPDEGWAVQIASNIGHFGIDGTQFSPGVFQHVSTVAVSYPLLYALGLWLKLFGTGVFQARLMMLAYMLLFAGALYALARRLFGPRCALASLALLATFPPFYAIGKSVYGETSVLLFLALTMLCLNYAFKEGSHRRLWFILAGIFAGVCMAAKPMALVLGPILIVVACIAFRRKLVGWREIGIVLASAIVPLIVWAIVSFHYPGSLAHIGDFYSNPAAFTDRSTAFMLALKFLLTTSGALYCLAFVALWIAGMAIRVAQRRQISTEEWIGFLFAAITLATFFLHYADSRYLFPVQALAMIFVPYSTMAIIDALPVRMQGMKASACIVIVALLVALGLYQLSYSSYVAQSYSSTVTHDMAAYFGSIPPTRTVFFYNAMNAVPLFHGSSYYQRIVMFEKWKSGAEYAPLIRARVPDIIAVTSFSAEDGRVPLNGYEQVATFGKMRVFAKKGI